MGQEVVWVDSISVICVEMDDAVAERFFKMEWLDGIGPARYGEIEQLKGAKIEEVDDE